MKECPRCGKENLDEAKFCTGCSFELREDDPKGKGNKLKLIGVLIVLIIIVLGVGLYFTMNNNTQVNSDVNNSDSKSVDGQINSNKAKTDDIKFKAVDFNGLFRMDLPSECHFYDTNSSRYGSNHTWYGSTNSFDEINYFEGFNNIEDVLSQFSISKIETEGNLIVFDSHGSINSYDRYYVGIQSKDNKFVVLSTTNINYLDDMKKSANSVVFE